MRERLPALLLAMAALAPRAVAQCPAWQPGFGGTGMDEPVFTMRVLDDGSGPALYAGGDFLTAGGVWAPYVAKWDGAHWSPVGSWLGSAVLSLAVFDDGHGTALYVGGGFPEHVLKWNGTSWQPLAPSPNGAVFDMTVFDDGSGPALYATGQFTQVGTLQVNGVAKWNGTTWSALGTGLARLPFSAQGNVLTVFDDGGGPALFVGGQFMTAGGVTVNNVAKWNGSSWSALAGGVDAGLFGTSVSGLVELPQPAGSPPKLCAGGDFTTAGLVSANGVAVWDGAAWSPMAAGFDGYVTTLASYDDGAGRALYAGGGFAHSGAASCKCIARWNGSSWSELGGGTPYGYVNTLAGFESGTRTLFAGGGFFSMGTAQTRYAAAWRGGAWRPLTRGMGLQGDVEALATFDAGGGPALYAGGWFQTSDDPSQRTIARWTGASWSDVGGGLDGVVADLTTFDDGNGAALYAAGSFLHAGAVNTFGVARWNGTAWSGLGTGVLSSASALAVFDDGSGEALYAGGDISSAGGVSVNNIARWNGSAWSAVGSGTNSRIVTFAVFDDGTGPALYAGGLFTSAGGSPANYVARWDGVAWTALGPGTDAAVEALAVFDDGSGPALYAGGEFTHAGGAIAYHIARWSGATWSTVGGGLTGFGTAEVACFTVYDDGTGGGPALYVGGTFSWGGGTVAPCIARWDGSSWSALGEGLIPPINSFGAAVHALHVYDPGTGAKPALFAGGVFIAAPPLASVGVAEWPGCDAVGTLECFGDGSGTACPCGNVSAPGDRAGCLNSTLAGGALRDGGVASLAHDTLVLQGSDMPHSTELYLQGSDGANGGAGLPYGDGLRCVGGTIRRIGLRPSTGGSSSYPGNGDPPVSVRGAVGAPGTRRYQIVFRDAASYCTPATLNATNGLRIVWTP